MKLISRLSSILGALTVLVLSGCAMPILSEADKPEPVQPFLSDAIGSVNQDVPRKFSLDAVYFHTGKDILRYTAQLKLDIIISATHYYNPTEIIIEGNADNRGGLKYNKRLSARRAQAVKTALIRGGINSQILHVQANGETQPIASNRTRNGRQLNRRVDVTLR
jgi:outer membrane protein OmpA-like peptidoglycan-associated protein